MVPPPPPGRVLDALGLPPRDARLPLYQPAPCHPGPSGRDHLVRGRGSSRMAVGARPWRPNPVQGGDVGSGCGRSAGGGRADGGGIYKGLPVQVRAEELRVRPLARDGPAEGHRAAERRCGDRLQRQRGLLQWSPHRLDSLYCDDPLWAVGAPKQGFLHGSHRAQRPPRRRGGFPHGR